MMRGPLVLLAIVVLVGLQAQAAADVILGSEHILGTAQTYGVLGASTVTNTGTSVINGDLGLYPGTAISGFGGSPLGTVTGATNLANAAAGQAEADALTGYNTLWSLASTANLTGQDLEGMTLLKGVYDFNSSALLSFNTTGILTLDANFDPTAYFVFRMKSTLTTMSDTQVVVINPPSEEWASTFCQKYFLEGSSATLGTGTQFEGTLIAEDSITLNTGADIVRGRALALTGAVTMDTNTITTVPCDTTSTGTGSIPEPGTFALLLTALPMGLAWRRRRRA